MSLILCADGGGTKVSVVVRSRDGVEARGYAGPSNVQSVGYHAASQNILLATYRALAQLPAALLPASLGLPEDISCHSSSPASPLPLPDARPILHPLPTPPSSVSSAAEPTLAAIMNTHLAPPLAPPATRSAPSPSSPAPRSLPPLNTALFRAAWLGLAGISSKSDQDSFRRYIAKTLCMDEQKVQISNDVNLLAAPALDIPGITHVLALVAGTGSVGRTIRLSPSSPGSKRSLPLEDVAVAKGWGYLLCDEGSAYWLGRLSIRHLLSLSDRLSSSSIYSSPPPPLLPLHQDLLDYFGVTDPVELIGLMSLGESELLGLGMGEAVGRRNALVAGAARVVFRYAFPNDKEVVKDREDKERAKLAQARDAGADGDGEDWGESERSSTSSLSLGMEETPSLAASPPRIPPLASPPSPSHTKDSLAQCHTQALTLTSQSVSPLISLTLSLLGDRSIVRPASSCLALGGGLMMSEGYRGLLLDGLRERGVEVGRVVVVGDAAVEGVRGLGKVEWG
ncbi:hypothetical protein IAR50_006694 [Cryptococcus sp. DSM 104548]